LSLEASSPVNGYYPALRELVVRRVRTGAETKIPLPCGQVPECWPGFPTWSADSRHLSFTLRQPGSHTYAVYTAGSDGAGLTKQLDFKGTIVELRYLPDGRLTMLATQDARKEVGATEAGAAVAGDLDLPPAEQRIAILDHGAIQWASPADLFVYEYDWRPDAKGFVGTAAPGDGDNNWWTAKLYAFEGGNGRVLYAPTDIRQQIATPKVSRDGRTVAFIGGIMSDFGSTGGDIYTLPAAGGAATNITPSGVTASSMESFTSPPEIRTGVAGKWKALTTINAGMSVPARVQSLTWQSDGFNVQGWLLLPEHANGKVPMLTSVHGGPASATMPSFRGPGLQRTLLERGYALFLPNPRGSFGQGEQFAAANVRDFGHGDLRDILAGVDAAEKAAPIDGTRLGITGGSYGGFMSTSSGMCARRRLRMLVNAISSALPRRPRSSGTRSRRSAFLHRW
jgi:dipeptidyl aminopeptidase/acylaminoacyl peptidase